MTTAYQAWMARQQERERQDRENAAQEPQSVPPALRDAWSRDEPQEAPQRDAWSRDEPDDRRWPRPGKGNDGPGLG